MSEIRMRAKYVNIRTASARDIAERWRSAHLRDGQWVRPQDEQIYLSLDARGADITVEQAAEIIGNKSWSYISCSGCPEYVERAVEIGDSDAKAYCETCIREAHHILIGDK